MLNSTLPLLATIDLGSNSFHMLVVQYDATQPHATNTKVVTKIKRKVRLASGLDHNGMLSEEAIQRGLDCLAWFADTLEPLPITNIMVAATATLRLAKNAQQFVQRAAQILPYPIQVLSGEQEASFIYQGASLYSSLDSRQLVVDIGGASTEIIIGQGSNALALTSLNLGCVTWFEQFFGDKKISESRFKLAISAAKKELASIKHDYQQLGWQACLGASGTVQTIKQIMQAEQRDTIITHALLLELKQRMVDSQHIDALNIAGLAAERAIVFPSGIAILLAIFEELQDRKSVV